MLSKCFPPVRRLNGRRCIPPPYLGWGARRHGAGRARRAGWAFADLVPRAPRLRGALCPMRALGAPARKAIPLHGRAEKAVSLGDKAPPTHSHSATSANRQSLRDRIVVPVEILDCPMTVRDRTARATLKSTRGAPYTAVRVQDRLRFSTYSSRGNNRF